MNDKKSRRDVLVLGGKMGAAAVTALLVPSNYVFPNSEESPGYDWNQHQYVYLVDTTKCIGCGMCVRACKRENNVPDHFYRTWVERYMISETGEWSVERESYIDSPDGGMKGFEPQPTGFNVTKAFFVPKLCNHCRNSPCSQVCPVGASYRTRDGMLMVDKERCIGCGYCVQACPFGSRFLNPITKTADKCTWCYHRVVRGLKTACVQNCPTGARRFGDLRKEDDPVRTIISTERVRVLQPQLLTEPSCFYLGLDQEVR